MASLALFTDSERFTSVGSFADIAFALFSGVPCAPWASGPGLHGTGCVPYRALRLALANTFTHHES
eukprot:5658312-Alexandrium_andersonii.AAC.1